MTLRLYNAAEQIMYSWSASISATDNLIDCMSARTLTLDTGVGETCVHDPGSVTVTPVERPPCCTCQSEPSSGGSPAKISPTCQYCTNGTVPASFEVTIPTMANRTAFCTESPGCPSLAGTYVLTDVTPGNCKYQVVFSPTVCGYDRLTLFITSTGYHLSLSGLDEGASSATYWNNNNYPTPPKRDCSVTPVTLFAPVFQGLNRCNNAGLDATAVAIM